MCKEDFFAQKKFMEENAEFEKKLKERNKRKEFMKYEKGLHEKEMDENIDYENENLNF
jgi:hypothetical protein